MKQSHFKNSQHLSSNLKLGTHHKFVNCITIWVMKVYSVRWLCCLCCPCPSAWVFEGRILAFSFGRLPLPCCLNVLGWNSGLFWEGAAFSLPSGVDPGLWILCCPWAIDQGSLLFVSCWPCWPCLVWLSPLFAGSAVFAVLALLLECLRVKLVEGIRGCCDV